MSECLSYNQRRGSENKFPATFKRCLEIAKEVAITSGYAADLLCVRSDPYCGKRGAAASSSAQKVQDLEKEVKELRQWKQTMASRQPNQSYGQRQNRGRDSFMKPYGRATQQQSSYTHQQQASNYIQANQRSFNNIPAIQNQGQVSYPSSNSQPQQDLGNLTREKLAQTCVMFNGGGQCDGSCGLRHVCSNIVAPGRLCWANHAQVDHV